MADGDDLGRLLSRVDVVPNGCWLWTGAVNNAGYGSCYLGGRKTMAHRAAHVLLRGPIPEGLEIDHLCTVKRCVNPDHLEAVTHLENVRRSALSWHRTRTHCARGHELTEANSVKNMGRGKPQRRCRLCSNAAARKWERANRPTRAARTARTVSHG